MLVSAAVQLAGVGSLVGGANAGAAASTTVIVVSAQDAGVDRRWRC
ncbi:hypothetical protein [Mycobacterium spongiae]|uniref:PE family protein n=1 Tax=Mycobacterium spongiae TaxID=886343 RepID=A0A975PW61_9MYCO|nr:hypothetical protein [Mycobacterium spongiae]QUR66343.1 hypothetical protein F6B93_03895 [Mycobacterium spongiae]